MKTLIKVAVNDFRLVFRDNSLKIFLALPVFVFPAIRYGLPYVTESYEFLKDYINVFMMFAIMQGSVAFGFIYSMVLVDEKDTNVAKVYGILPVSNFWFVFFRLIPPFLLATAVTFLLLLFQTFYSLTIVANLLISALAGLQTPIMILFISIVSKNKIEAMTWQKLFSIPLYLPIFSFFVPIAISYIFAIFPTFWIYQSFDSLLRTENFLGYAVSGFIYNILLIAILIKKFTQNHFT